MPLNSTKEERDLKASQQTAQKMALENGLKRSIASVFAKIARDMESASIAGEELDATAYQQQIQSILEDHYVRVGGFFDSELTDFYEENKGNSEERITILIDSISEATSQSQAEIIAGISAQIRIALNLFAKEESKKSAAFITETNQEDIDAALVIAPALLADKLGREPTQLEIAKESRKVLRDKLRSRESTIAEFETQKAAEGAKSIERDLYKSIANDSVFLLTSDQILTIESFWVTIGDSKVRPAHREADNTKKQPEGYFIVGGQRLLYPGDTSLGASLDNVINCRCSEITKTN